MPHYNAKARARSLWRLLSRPSVIPIACLILALLRRSAAWDPPSLYLDDQWMALGIRYLDLAEIVRLHLPTPIGFVVLEKFAAGVANDLEWPLQIVPSVFGLAVIPAFYLVARRLVTHPLALGLSCLLATCHQAAELYAMRVKHYTLDLLFCIVLSGVMLDAARQQRFTRFMALVALGLVGALFSFASLFISVTFVHVIVADRVWRCWFVRTKEPGGQAPRVWPYLLVAGMFDLAVLAFDRGFLAHQSSPEMKAFWRTYFLHFDSVGTVLLWFARRLLALPFYALSPYLVVLVPFVWLGGKSLWSDARLRLFAWAACAILALLVIAAALDIYPLGAERTGLFCYPLFWLLAAVGCERVLLALPRERIRRGWLLVLALYTAGALVLRPRVNYSDDRDRQVVEEVLRHRRSGDGLLMQNFGLLALSYYSGTPVHFAPSSLVCHNFEARPSLPDLAVLPLAVGDVKVRTDPTLVDGLLETYYQRYARVLYVSTHASDKLDEHVVAVAEGRGYIVQRFDKSRESRLFILTRPYQRRQY